MTLIEIFPPVAWWQFWNPGSGLPGGIIYGAILGTLVFRIIRRRK